jgi:DNA-binding PadR family transcriptional regulator
MSAQPLNDMGRFLEPALIILVALADGPRHGYAIMDEAGERWGYAVGPGTLYGALGRLEDQGLIEALPADDRRRPYRLTADGRAVLRSHLRGMRQIATHGLRVMRAT